MLQDNVDLICRAMAQDLGRKPEEVQFTEVWTSMREVDLAVKRLKSWMKDETNVRDTILAFKLNNPRVRKQPKGVVLAIGPWNYPWYLNIGPLIGAIAAGCPIIIKPSEHSKHNSLLLSQLVAKYLDPEAHHVVLGAVECSTRLLELRYGHIFFTGSTSVGRIVAIAAAKQLVPCTLELGGKSPVIITKTANLEIAARRILAMKSFAAGQQCTNADYVLVPTELAQAFTETCQRVLDEFYPPNDPTRSPTQSADMSQLVHAPHFKRIAGFIDQAKQDGHQVIGGQLDEANRKVGLTCVVVKPGVTQDPSDRGGMMGEEIFGPVLPIVSIDVSDPFLPLPFSSLCSLPT